MLWRRFGGGSLIICFLAFFGCTLKTVDTTEAGNHNALTAKVLIATQAGEFKRTVVSEIKDNLGNNVFYVKVVDVKWLPNESADDFNAIVILNRCLNSKTWQQRTGLSTNRICRTATNSTACPPSTGLWLISPAWPLKKAIGRSASPGIAAAPSVCWPACDPPQSIRS